MHAMWRWGWGLNKHLGRESCPPRLRQGHRARACNHGYVQQGQYRGRGLDTRLGRWGCSYFRGQISKAHNRGHGPEDETRGRYRRCGRRPRGICETTRSTTHDDPTYIVLDVVHYCVINMRGAMPRTSTYALTNSALSYALEIADKGVGAAMARNRALRRGLKVYMGASPIMG